MPATSDQLHTNAMEAEKNLEALATGIAGVGASDDDVKAVTQMAHMCRQIAVSLAKGGTQQPAPPQSTNDAIAAHFAQQRAAAAPPQPPA